MDSKTYQSILETVCYADIFEYPLREEEVRRWRDIKILRSASWRIRRANGAIMHKDKFMYLKGRERLVVKRREREKVSKEKLIIARRIVSVLKYISTVKLVGVSGSVAMKNATKDDDIDLFIVAQAGTLWLTRFFATIIVEIFGTRRRPNDITVADKICLNMFVDEDYLAIPEEKRNFYTAHEVCQLGVLYDRDGTYQRFLKANSWVREFLPNGIVISKKQQAIRKNVSLISYLLSPLESLFKHLQLWYMRKHHTTEAISDSVLAFHPKDYTQDVLTALEKRLTFYGSQV